MHSGLEFGYVLEEATSHYENWDHQHQSSSIHVLCSHNCMSCTPLTSTLLELSGMEKGIILWVGSEKV